MTRDQFDDLTDVYESFVDWPKRLAREGPFFRRLFADHGVARVVDVACGTGHHAALFHRWALQVEGADVSAGMIERAKHQFGEPPGLRFVERSFTAAVEPEGKADAVICIGNSLALADRRESARQALLAMLRAVRPGGLVVVQLLNLWALPDGPCQWQKCARISYAGREAIVIKGIHRSAQGGFVDAVVSAIEPPEMLVTQSVPLLGLSDQELLGWATSGGAAAVRLLGDYHRAPYDAPRSPDLIAVITRESSDTGRPIARVS